MQRIDYEKNLNPAQREAVFSGEGAVLVIAGAGSGKTRTLVYRVAYLVESGIPPERILLLTFTRKAAQEMLGRVEAMLQQSCQGVAGGTFHALAYRILRHYGSRIGLRSPLTVLDRKDSEELVGRIIKEKKWVKGKEVPDKKDFLDGLSRLTNRGLSWEQGRSQGWLSEWASLTKLSELHQEYEDHKSRYGLLDYDDLLTRCLQLFRQEAEVVERLAGYYQYILVDEYQDTNLLQAEIVRFLARKNIMVVGDDSQSIYGFRGAHYKNIFSFPRQFPGTRIVKLEENFRSSQPILNLANLLIGASQQRYSKCLYARFPEGDPPLMVEVPFEESQSQYVTRSLQTFHGRGIPWREMAVLFRAGHHSFNLEVLLQKENIPFRKYGGKRLVEGAHIKDVLSYLKVVLNPRDVLAWERILRLLEGVGPKKSREIIRHLEEGDDWPARLACLSQFPRLQSRLSPLAMLLQGLLDPTTASPTQALEQIWEYYRELLPGLYDEPQRRQKEIEEIIRVSYNYNDPETLLADLSLEVYEGPEGEERDGLTLSTVHSAKGLEWKVVFIIWLTEGRFPSAHSLLDPEELEEERRLLYVAVTRAKERLFLIYPQSLSPRAGGWQRNEPCPFLNDIPEEVLPRVTGADPYRGIQGSTPATPSPPARDEGFSTGTRVFHPIFGNGVVEEGPIDRKVRVFFKRYGVKVLHLDYARLERGKA